MEVGLWLEEGKCSVDHIQLVPIAFLQVESVTIGKYKIVYEQISQTFPLCIDMHASNGSDLK